MRDFRLRVGGVDLVEVGKTLLARIDRDDLSGLAAELSYLFFLSLFPFFIFLAALSGFVAKWLGLPDPTALIIGTFGQAIPPEAQALIGPQIEYVVANQRPELLSFGALVALWVATGGTKALMKAMNRAYGVPETRSFVKLNGTAVWMTVLGSVLLVAACVVFLLSQTIGRTAAESIGAGSVYAGLLLVVNVFGPVVFLALALVFLYRRSPNLKLPFRWLTPGSVLFSVGWTIATFGFAFYVSNFSSFGATYGALGGIVILLLWFYLVSFILVIGAEVNAVVDDIKMPDELNRQRREKRAELERKKRKKEERRSGG